MPRPIVGIFGFPFPVIKKGIYSDVWGLLVMSTLFVARRDTVDAEIKVPSAENHRHQRSPPLNQE